MSLKKSLKSLNKVRHGEGKVSSFFYIGSYGQAALEYFLLMAAVAVCVVIGGSRLLDNVHQQTEVLTNEAADIMFPDSDDFGDFEIGE